MQCGLGHQRTCNLRAKAEAFGPSFNCIALHGINGKELWSIWRNFFSGFKLTDTSIHTNVYGHVEHGPSHVHGCTKTQWLLNCTSSFEVPRELILGWPGDILTLAFSLFPERTPPSKSYFWLHCPGSDGCFRATETYPIPASTSIYLILKVESSCSGNRRRTVGCSFQDNLPNHPTCTSVPKGSL